MNMQYMVLAAIGVAAVMVGSAFTAYQLYKLVRLDAECRGLKHPKLWGTFSLGQNGSGLIFYLIGRRKYPVLSITEEQATWKTRYKKRLGVSLSFQAGGAILFVLGMFLGGEI